MIKQSKCEELGIPITIIGCGLEETVPDKVRDTQSSTLMISWGVNESICHELIMGYISRDSKYFHKSETLIIMLRGIIK
ncbi:hypothetical protein CEXT_26201 [Caerostris extrusa]|uniref:Uncharacterized protein n=1 Tax=Caerostris extrusa TaxID=172846 RepID=A0AAV4Q3J6_CAEEX|nr:hypothetical protein CEXT_26201 [Caerostris extrusa]